MSTFLGVLGIIAFIVCVIGFAAAVTYIVVRISPANKRKRPQQPTSPS
jgi:hypothetical protein